MGNNQWLMWPVTEQAFAFALVLCVAPGVWAAWAVSHGLVGIGLIAVVTWLVPFGLLLRALHVRKSARLVVTIPCAVLLLTAAVLV
jgi:hypothetical protein